MEQPVIPEEIYMQVSRKLNIPLTAVRMYDDAYWSLIRKNLNHPTWDVLEIPFLGAFYLNYRTLDNLIHVKVRAMRKHGKGSKYYPAMVEDFKFLWNLRRYLQEQALIPTKWEQHKKKAEGVKIKIKHSKKVKSLETKIQRKK